jgi:hypothetical protein
MKTSILSLLLLLLAHPISLDRQIQAPPEPTAIWHVETVDGAAKVGKVTSLALDSLGRPHIAYPDMGPEFDSPDLKYAWHDGTNWHVETVLSENWVGEYCSLALDAADRPHISAYDNGSLVYGWHDGANWHFETVDTRGGYYTSLALDSLGRPHISYQGNFGFPDMNFDLKYAWHDGARFHVETVDVGDTGYDTSLALDEFDHPHISHYDWTLEDLKYAWHDGVRWHSEIVDGQGHEDTALALDSSSHPHISYYASGSLKHAWYDGALWHTEIVDSEGGLSSSLALDSSDHPHISYYGSEGLMYAWNDGGHWHIETAVSGWGGEYTSLALDESGQPHVSYRGGGLAYAYRTPLPPLSLRKQAAPHQDLHNNDILTYTLTLSGPGLYVRLWDSLPDPVHYVSGSLTSDLTPTVSYSPTLRAVVWEGTLPTDTVPTIRFQVTPGITGTGSLLLATPIINTAWLIDTKHGRSRRAMVIVNGDRLYLPLIIRSP